jgi:hypothetical protein
MMKQMRNYFLIHIIIFLLLTIPVSQAQTIYSIDVSNSISKVQPGHFKMGNAGTIGKEIIINNRFLSIGGIPQIPVMGEMQFSRIDGQRWEDVILKMKAAGINIIATYIFWIHHEEIEGQFDWSGNKDFRSFVQLCAKHDMLIAARIGPWVHGEVRNGGTPDWILTKKLLKNRTNDPVYQFYVSRFYQQIGEQLHGLFYKNDGPVMTIQLENEYTKGKSGEAHIKWLKETAIHYGMDVPMYTVTGWGDGSVPAGEVIPMWGGYPDQPWDPTIEKMKSCIDFEFNPFRNDDKIGNGLAKKKEQYMDYSDEPFFTCEMGLGVQTTKHRRTVINQYDGLALATSRIGAGSNLLGFYVFAGGSNPTGALTAMNEDMDETGNWSETPAISYDFQAAISESGFLAPSYYQSKKLNYFLNEFGTILAPMEPFFSSVKDGFQYAVRADEKSAFVFGINYCRFEAKPKREKVQFKVQLSREEVIFPSKPIDIEDSTIFIWPVNMEINGLTLKYATAQPLCKISGSDKEQIWVFFQNLKTSSEFCFDTTGIQTIETEYGNVKKSNRNWIIGDLIPGKQCIINLTGTNGKKQKILLLTHIDALHFWILKDHDKKHFLLSDETLYLDGDVLTISGSRNNQKISLLDGGCAVIGMQQSASDGIFTVYENTVEAKTLQPDIIPVKLLDEALWLKTSVDYIDAKNKLYHKLFVKEFNLGNPSGVKSAILYVSAPSHARVQVNNVWVNQSIDTSRICAIDITGYVKKGDNNLMMDFPFLMGSKSFAARVIVDYYNTDEISFVTDTSWRMAEQYYYPAPLGTFANFFSTPQVTVPPASFNDTYNGFSEYKLTIPANYLEGLNNLYLSTKYTGIRAELRMHHKLIADNYNNNTNWNVNLNRYGSQLQNRSLLLKVFPLQTNDRILFDIPPIASDIGKAVIETITFIPEYKGVFKLIPKN